MDFKRVSRKRTELREIYFDNKFSPYAEGSCLVKFGNTHVICTASIEERVPIWLRGKQRGWITAEYGMIPRATHSRVDREISKGKISGRSQEIQRLIGRSLRSAVNLNELGERQIKIDCDVIQADGGTRTASISGSWIALHDAIKYLMSQGKITQNPIKNQVAAISCGIFNESSILDLDYEEDSNVNTDANFVLNQDNEIIEIQVSAEKKPFSYKNFEELFQLSKKGVQELLNFQKKAIEDESFS